MSKFGLVNGIRMPLDVAIEYQKSVDAGLNPAPPQPEESSQIAKLEAQSQKLQAKKAKEQEASVLDTVAPAVETSPAPAKETSPTVKRGRKPHPNSKKAQVEEQLVL